jgi:hypothetical protein
MLIKRQSLQRRTRRQRCVVDNDHAIGSQETRHSEAAADSSEETSPLVAVGRRQEQSGTNSGLPSRETQPFEPGGSTVRPDNGGSIQTPSLPPRPLQVGGRFRLIEQVHHGRMSMVWRAVDDADAGDDDHLRQLSVAVKLVPLKLAPAFDEEALAQLVEISAHPGLVTLIEHGCEQDWWYQVADWVDGQTLESLLKSQSGVPGLTTHLPRWMSQIAAALGAQHQAGFVHGDVKPSNVLICQGRLGHVDSDARLIDLVGLRTGASWTRHGGLTPAYASPDAIGGAPADPRDDVYSLATMALQMLTGKLAFPRHVQNGQARGATPPVGLTPAQWRALREGLEPVRGRRAHSATALVAALWPEPVKVPSRLPRAMRTSSQKPLLPVHAYATRPAHTGHSWGAVAAAMTMAALVLGGAFTDMVRERFAGMEPEPAAITELVTPPVEPAPATAQVYLDPILPLPGSAEEFLADVFATVEFVAVTAPAEVSDPSPAAAAPSNPLQPAVAAVAREVRAEPVAAVTPPAARPVAENDGFVEAPRGAVEQSTAVAATPTFPTVILGPSNAPASSPASSEEAETLLAESDESTALSTMQLMASARSPQLDLHGGLADLNRPDPVARPEISDPGIPDRPAVPDQPVVPDRPVVPDQPVVVDRPAVPDQPVVVDRPVVPDRSVVVERPVVPDRPAVPDRPVVPDRPAMPAVPERPVVPGRPPAMPARPGRGPPGRG